MTAIDSNVLIDLVQGSESELRERAFAAIRARALQGPLVVSPIVHVELGARPVGDAEARDALLGALRVRIDWTLSEAIWRLAGDRFAAYARRRRTSGAGEPRRVAADFVNGAHACTAGSFLTRDVAFYRRSFPELPLYEP